MEKSVRWGILGAGRIAQKFASAISFTEGNEVYAVASRERDKASDFAGRYHAVHIYDQYANLAEDPSVDIIYVATPHAFHCEQSIMCLEHKKPVVCEKPMALNYEQVSRMADTARTHQTFLMEGMWSAFMPSIRKMLQLIEEDAIGPVEYVRADFGFNAPYDPEGRLYNLKLGGGSLLDVGIYPLFLATLLMGEPARIHSVAKLAGTGADEYCSMQFQYAGGQIATIFSSITIKTSLTAEIAGPKGRIFLQSPFYKSNELTLELNSGESNRFSFPYEHNGFEYEVREAAQCLRKGYTESSILPLDFSLRMARVMDTVRAQCGIVYG